MNKKIFCFFIIYISLCYISKLIYHLLGLSGLISFIGLLMFYVLFPDIPLYFENKILEKIKKARDKK